MNRLLNLGAGAALGLSLTLAAGAAAQAQDAAAAAGGGVIFFHPDGAGVNHWGALRLREKGPDGVLNWDKLPALGVYTGHMKDSPTGTSHGGATTHAYGVKVVADSFGLDGEAEITAASGRTMSIAREALEAGKAVALVQTGHISEPGTAAFVASVPSRKMTNEIAEQVIGSGAQVILAGGERMLLPEGVFGRHGPGDRKDGRNLVEEARAAGYAVVYNREELLAVDPASTEKLLGVFAYNHSFHDFPEEMNQRVGRPSYEPDAPTVAEMTKVALDIVSRDPDGFFAVIEEEGTDNFSNAMNASGALEALARADSAIGEIQAFLETSPESLMVLTSDSDAGGLQVMSHPRTVKPGQPLPAVSIGGGVLKGAGGVHGFPFVSAPDAAGVTRNFAIGYVGHADTAGGILVRAAGRGAERVTPLMDNTDVYKLMYWGLFGSEL